MYDIIENFPLIKNNNDKNVEMSRSGFLKCDFSHYAEKYVIVNKFE